MTELHPKEYPSPDDIQRANNTRFRKTPTKKQKAFRFGIVMAYVLPALVLLGIGIGIAVGAALNLFG